MGEIGRFFYGIGGARVGEGADLCARDVATHRENLGGSSRQGAEAVMKSKLVPLRGRKGRQTRRCCLTSFAIRSPFALSNCNSLVFGLGDGTRVRGSEVQASSHKPLIWQRAQCF